MKRGARQEGCVVTGFIYDEMMKEIESTEGIRVEGQNTNNTRYTNDIMKVADSNDRLQAIITATEAEGEKRGLRINMMMN